MKTISTLLSSFLLTTSAFAADFRPSASLTIKAADRAPIVVMVDGKCFDIGSSSIMISGLEPTYHQVKVYHQSFQGSVGSFGYDRDVLFNGPVLLKPRTNLTIAVDECGAITMNEATRRNREFGDTWSGGRNYYPSPGGSYSNGTYSKAMNDFEFDRVLWAISKESFERNRMRSAEQIISTNYFTTGQLRQLLGLFNFEGNKLELAKFGYDKVVDQSNYYTLSDLFSFNSSRDELARCIRK